MIPVKIDISDFVSEWNLTAEEADLFVFNVLDEIAERFSDNWKNEAGKVLKQTRQEYQKSIYIEKPDPYSVAVGLAGWLPNAIEKGIEPFDMKLEGFSKSDKRKFKKNGGWYLTIPFRIGTPGIVADSSIFSSIMPNEVYKVVLKELEGDSKRSLSVSELPEEFRIKGIRPEVINKVTQQVFPVYQHKNSIYEGMRKSDEEHHGHYVTFRRVSDLSDPNSWIHSGIVAHDLMKKTFDNFPFSEIVSNVKENFLKNR